MNIEQRKKDHVDLCVSGRVDYDFDAGFERYHFRHNALPEVDLGEISTECTFLGRTFAFPLFISSMTGGYAQAGAVNAIISSFCEKHNLPFGVGSQRVMLEKPETTASFSIVREVAPHAFIAANIGGCQLISSTLESDLGKIISCIKADALIIHLNPLQELMQPEGDVSYKGIKDGIKKAVEFVNIPVIVKETGAGISKEVALKLIDCGVHSIDIAGAGGTSWAKVENERAGVKASTFNNWGLPTAFILEEYGAEICNKVQVISSGGIRTSFDIAKSLCLGASIGAAAQPVIQAIVDEGEEGLELWYNSLVSDMKKIMCLLGISRIEQFGSHHLIKRA